MFGRDSLEVEVLNAARTESLFTLFNTHLKSHFVPHNEGQGMGVFLLGAVRAWSSPAGRSTLAGLPRTSGWVVLATLLGLPGFHAPREGP